MAYIGLKQLDPILTGSLQVSGSAGFTGSIEVSGNISGSSTSTGSFGHFIGDGSGLTNVFEGTVPSASISTRLTNTEATASSFLDGTSTLISGSSTSTGSFGRVEARVVEANTYIVSSSVTNISIATISGSTEFGDDSSDNHRFTGSLLVTGSLNVESGRIFEQGSSVIDHATAMAIVFGG